MNKKYYLLILALSTVITSAAQMMSVRMQNGKVVNYNLNNVEDVSFSNKQYPEPQSVGHTVTLTETMDGNTYDISQYQSMSLNDILSSYMEDYKTADNKVFLLEGGKTYHISNKIDITKGITIRTNPADAAKGLRARLYIGGLFVPEANLYTGIFMLGRQPEVGENPSDVLDIDSIRFIDLDVSCPLAINYGDAQEGKGDVTVNYFMNKYGNGMGVNVNYMEWKNCTFQNLIRGFFRIQGGSPVKIHEMKLTDCVFYNCGYYNTSGFGYSYIHYDCNGNTVANAFENVEISGNVLYDCPMGPLVTDGRRNVIWDENVRWNINVHHNTFVNFNTRSAQSIMNLRSIPGGSTVKFSDNLIVLTKDEADVNRTMTNCGIEVREIQGGDGTGLATFVVNNNYSTSDNLTNGQVFTGYAMSSTSGWTIGRKYKTFDENAAVDVSRYFPMGRDGLEVTADNIKATELMVSPNPQHFIDETATGKDHHTDMGIDGLYYQKSDKVLNSFIYKMKVGAPRLFVGR